ncbi:MAG TPA: DMT family transporter [Actinomycetota bacterium]
MTHLLSLVGIVSISFSAIFVRLADVSPDTAAFFRAAYAVPALVLVWLVTRRRDERTPRERWMAFGAGLFLALDFSFWHRAIGDIGAGLATVIGNTQVVFVGIYAWIFLRERPTRLAFVLVPTVFLGVLLISGLGREDAFGSNPLGGVFWGVLTGLGYTGFLILLRRSNRSLSPPAGPMMEATTGALLGMAILAPIFDPAFSVVPTWPAHGWLLALALICQVFGWLLITVALPRLPSLETSVMLLLQPMLTVLWAYLLFSEILSIVQWLGVALALIGVGTLAAKGSVEPDVERDTVLQQ